MNCEQKYYLATGVITKHFYESYIKDNVSKTIQKKFIDLLRDENNDFIEYYRVGIDNPDDSENEFSSLWFFDIGLDKGCIPVFLSCINTSSCLAMELSCMDRDDEDEYNYKSLEDLLDYAPDKSKETVKNIILMTKG